MRKRSILIEIQRLSEGSNGKAWNKKYLKEMHWLENFVNFVNILNETHHYNNTSSSSEDMFQPSRSPWSRAHTESLTCSVRTQRDSQDCPAAGSLCKCRDIPNKWYSCSSWGSVRFPYTTQTGTLLTTWELFHFVIFHLAFTVDDR